MDEWSGSPGHTVATGAVYNVLALENPEEDWDGINFGKIDFDMLYASELPFFPLCTTHDIVIKIKDDISGECNSSTARACAKRLSGPSVDPYSGHSEWGDLYGEFDYGVIYYDDDHWDDLSDRRHLLNHEVGHLFGLQDGGSTNPHWPTPLPPPPPAGPTPFPVPLPSVTQDPRSCSPPSIMHSYGCSGNYEREWPSFEDRFALENHIPDAGSGGGLPPVSGRGWYSVPY